MTAASAAPERVSLGVVCPRCRGEVAPRGDAYLCARCDVSYPVVLGIPDFRVFPDPWIGLEEDREKARRLEARSQGASLEDMVRTYWSMTPGTPEARAERFIRHVIAADERSREWLGLLEPGGLPLAGTWLDVGTGTGDLACAIVERGGRALGVDIAMRWLVVARRRAKLAGVEVDFVCCNAEYLPFADATISRVVSVGTIEHCDDANRVFTEARRVLVPRGDLRIRTVNRFTLLPEPHVGIWGVGWVPRRMADRYVRWRGGQGYQHHRPLSARELKRGLARAGFASIHVGAAPMLAAERERLGRLRWAARVYDRSRQAPVARVALRWTAPLLDVCGVAA